MNEWQKAAIDYCTLTTSEPVEELLVAVTVAWPAAPKVAVGLAEEAKLKTLELLDDQVVELVTSVPLRLAANVTVPDDRLNGPQGVITIPVGAVSVAVPLTPL